MRIFSRHFLKEAGEKEAKKAKGINFSYIQKLLSNNGLKQVSKEEIQTELNKTESLKITKPQMDLIQELNLTTNARKRVNDIEAALIIIGSVLTTSSSEEAKHKVELFNWYLEYKELSPGSMNLANNLFEDFEKMLEAFKDIYLKARETKKQSEAAAGKAEDNNYISNEVVHDFGDGWKVVYVPAAGENGMPEYPGLPGTSHDRILEGDKNGLCLGSHLKLYQTEGSGKIYSVRDPGNKPRVTIRIEENNLEEAKGKNNTSPDIEGAIHAAEWFKLESEKNDLNYEENDDFKKFPPLNLDAAKSAFNEDRDSPYKKTWVSAWYQKGLPELDADVLARIKNNDPLIFQSGLGKSRLELVKPVVIHWCQEYLAGRADKKILFGNVSLQDIDEGLIINFPTHEIYKTYKKVPEMREAVKKLANEDPTLYINIGIQEIPEYREISDGPIKYNIKEDSYTFLDRFSAKIWAQPYLDIARKSFAEQDPSNFLDHFSGEDWAGPYLEMAGKSAAEKDPIYFLKKFSEKDWAGPYLETARKSAAEKNPIDFLKNFSEKDWVQPYLETARKSAAEKDPIYFLKNFSEKDWVQPYLDIARKSAAEKEPIKFLYYFSKAEWSRVKIPELNEKSYFDIARKLSVENYPIKFLEFFSHKNWAAKYIPTAAIIAAEKNPHDFINKFLNEDWANEERKELKFKSYIDYVKENIIRKKSSYHPKLLKLAKILNQLGGDSFKSEILELKKLFKLI